MFSTRDMFFTTQRSVDGEIYTFRANTMDDLYAASIAPESEIRKDIKRRSMNSLALPDYLSK